MLSTTNPPRSSISYARRRSAGFPARFAHRALVASLGFWGISCPAPAGSQASVILSQVPATALPLALPSVVAFAPGGSLYIAETGHHVIRTVDTAGVISTVAGTGIQGYGGDGAPATSADFNSPGGLIADGSGNLYIADTGNQRVRLMNAASGTVTTVAGTGAAGFSGDGGPALAARLRDPGALALDPGGNLYIADRGNHRVRKLTLATGVLTTVAGNGLQLFSGDGGPATSASIDSPTGLAFDPSGRLYIADTHNGRIRAVDSATGIISTVAGVGVVGASGDGGSAKVATLAGPRGLTTDAAGNLYITDSRNGRIRRVDAVTGLITTVAGDGVEAFAGDGSPAIAASLDTPRSIAFSPGARLTVADTGNGRVRQLTGPVQPATSIQTIAGLGTAAPGSFTLSAPAVVAYGSGSLTAALLAGSSAAGSVTFLETTSGRTSLLGTVPLSQNLATLSLAALPVGTHRLTATYSGDAAHSSAQSTSLQLTVTALQLTVAPAPASMLFGQVPPPLTGSVSGILPQDTASVSAAFLSAATSLTPPGAYPISAALGGPAAGNYALTLTPANLLVSRAPALVSLTSSLDAATGSVRLAAAIISTTSGVPTGTVTLLDALTPFAALKLGPGGASTLLAPGLTAGQHSFTASYSGDPDFTPATSAPSILSVPGTAPSSPAADFALSPTGLTSQTIAAGNSANYTFAVQLQGAALASPITLAATGLPSLATASFNPQYLPPGGAVSTFTVTIATPKSAHLHVHPQPGPARWMERLGPIAALALLCPLFGSRRRPRHRGRASLASACLLTSLLLFAVGCGDRIASTGATSTLKTYTVSISGTATAATGAILQHAATVTLNIQ